MHFQSALQNRHKVAPLGLIQLDLTIECVLQIKIKASPRLGREDVEGGEVIWQDVTGRYLRAAIDHWEAWRGILLDLAHAGMKPRAAE